MVVGLRFVGEEDLVFRQRWLRPLTLFHGRDRDAAAIDHVALGGRRVEVQLLADCGPRQVGASRTGLWPPRPKTLLLSRAGTLRQAGAGPRAATWAATWRLSRPRMAAMPRRRWEEMASARPIFM